MAKCVFMRAHRASSGARFTYRLCNASLTEVTKVNDLDPAITLRFDFRNHCLRITGKAIKTLGFIAKQYVAVILRIATINTLQTGCFSSVLLGFRAFF